MRETTFRTPFLDALLRGAGQVIFQANAVTGLFFLAAIVWGSVKAGQPAVAVGAAGALLVATATARVLRADRQSLVQGLFGFNGVLVGAALPTLFAATPAMWGLLVIGAAVSTVATLAVGTVMKTWGTPTLTFPFVLTGWVLVLAAHAAGLPAAVPGPATVGVPWPPLVEGWLKGPAQVFLIDDWVSGVLVVLGLAASSLPAAGFALLGSAIGIAVPLLLGSSSGGLAGGLDSFSPVLTAVAIGCVFYRPSWQSAAFALLAAAFTVLVEMAMGRLFGPIGLPVFTAPFVFATWLFLLPRADLAPHPHAPVAHGILKETGQ